MCGIFGVANHKDAAYLTYLGLHTLQHRGEEACGISSSNGKELMREIGPGQVSEGLKPEKLERLKGNFALGHVRYSTAGGSLELNAQPLSALSTPWGQIAMVHNGNIPGYKEMRSALQHKGALFHTRSDTEVLLVAIAQASQNLKSNKRPVLSEVEGYAISNTQFEEFVSVLRKALGPIQGAYSLMILTKEFMVAVRDPWGIRPLSLAKLGDGWALSSESTGFDLIEAKYEREIKAGEILIIPRNGKIKSYSIAPDSKSHQASCIFELVYFSRPDSYVFNRNVYDVRRKLGQILAKEAPAKGAELVIPVPDSANVQALGYAQGTGLPCEEGLVRSHYIGRTFIAPSQHIRDFGAKLKYNPVRSILKGKKVVVVDDSIVRGTTSRKIINLIRKVGGAKEVHMRVASPPITSPCFYGIDMPTKKELIASEHNVEHIRKFIGVDSLAYISLEGLLEASKNGTKNSYCHACFTGKYKIANKMIENELRTTV